MDNPPPRRARISDEDSGDGPAYVVFLIPIFVALLMIAGFLAAVIYRTP